MKLRPWLLLLPLFLLALPAQAQEDCGSDSLLLDMSAGDLMATAEASASGDAAEAPAEASLAYAEAEVREIIAEDGLHVVHFWAPWCGNSKRELNAGWSGLVEAHPEVSFTFVTIWNEGESGAQLMRAYNIPNRVRELLAQPPGGNGRIDEFLDLPVTWIPSTWIFNNNGELAFAMNYGEMKMETIDHLLDVSARDW